MAWVASACPPPHYLSAPHTALVICCYLLWFTLIDWPSLQHFSFCLPLFVWSCLCSLHSRPVSLLYYNTICHHRYTSPRILFLIQVLSSLPHPRFVLVLNAIRWISVCLITPPVFVQNHLRPVHSWSPIHPAPGLYNNRLFPHPAGSTSAWICICSLTLSNTWLYSHRTTWTDTGSAADCRLVERLSQNFSFSCFCFQTQVH